MDGMKERMMADGHRQNTKLYEESEISSSTVSITYVFVIALIVAIEKRKKVTVVCYWCLLERIYEI